MTDEYLLELVKAYYKDENIKKATLDLENGCIHITIFPPVKLERIEVNLLLKPKEND